MKNSRKITRSLRRWLCYAAVLVFFYMLMCAGAFRKWQPVFVLPLSVAVAMREHELGGAIFGAFCGLIIDISSDNLFGMSAVWLAPCCMFAAILVTNLIRVNFINHFWMSAIVCVIMAFMEYLFKYIIWNKSNSIIAFQRYIVPSYLSAVILSPAVYFLVAFIYVKFGKIEDTPELERLEREKNS